MPWSTWKRLVKKKNGSFFFFSYSKCLSIFDLFEGLWSGHIFGASASPRSLPKKWLCHPLSLFMAVSMIPNMWHRVANACGIRGRRNWGFMPEPARMNICTVLLYDDTTDVPGVQREEYFRLLVQMRSRFSSACVRLTGPGGPVWRIGGFSDFWPIVKRRAVKL